MTGNFLHGELHLGCCMKVRQFVFCCKPEHSLQGEEQSGGEAESKLFSGKQHSCLSKVAKIFHKIQDFQQEIEARWRNVSAQRDKEGKHRTDRQHPVPGAEGGQTKPVRRHERKGVMPVAHHQERKL
ncbi:MAG: hypothetical protein PUC00_02435 [Clostridiales bacterium]|nr:hypothetical protein [Clostridiales bacterium]